jgi:hypothetical protein
MTKWLSCNFCKDGQPLADYALLPTSQRILRKWRKLLLKKILRNKKHIPAECRTGHFHPFGTAAAMQFPQETTNLNLRSSDSSCGPESSASQERDEQFA